MGQKENPEEGARALKWFVCLFFSNIYLYLISKKYLLPLAPFWTGNGQLFGFWFSLWVERLPAILCLFVFVCINTCYLHVRNKDLADWLADQYILFSEHSVDID